jgi:hypothetical protein
LRDALRNLELAPRAFDIFDENGVLGGDKHRVRAT